MTHEANKVSIVILGQRNNHKQLSQQHVLISVTKNLPSSQFSPCLHKFVSTYRPLIAKFHLLCLFVTGQKMAEDSE